MSYSDVDICSTALIKLGAAPIESFGDISAEAEIASRLFSSVLEGVLVAHPMVVQPVARDD